MSGIVSKFELERRVAINDRELSGNSFKAEIVLVPDGDQALNFTYGTMHLTLTGDSQKLPDLKPSMMDEWLKDAIVALLTSKPEALD